MPLLEILISVFTTHHYLAYLILFLGSYIETLIGVAFFVYGEVFFLSGAILAGAGILNIWMVSIICIFGGILGDSSSYLIGRVYGKRFVNRFFNDENKHLTSSNYSKAEKFLHKYGKKSIFFARFLGPVSWVTPFLAGTLHIKYKDFLKYNIPGVILGIGMFMIAGYFFGFSYTFFFSKLREYLLYAVLIIVVFFFIYFLLKLRIFKRLKYFIFKLK